MTQQYRHPRRPPTLSEAAIYLAVVILAFLWVCSIDDPKDYPENRPGPMAPSVASPSVAFPEQPQGGR